VDEFTREALATAAARSFTLDDTTILLDQIIVEAGRRPETCAWITGLSSPQPQCGTGAVSARSTPRSSNPAHPGKNGYKQVVLTAASATSHGYRAVRHPPGAQVLAEDWRIEYNTVRPHEVLGGLSPIPPTVDDNQHSHDCWTTNRGPATEGWRPLRAKRRRCKRWI
jgi:transposase InsO family protein